jgi:excisionase family DNA binding protein
MKKPKPGPVKNPVAKPVAEPMFYIPVVKLRQPDGSLVVKAGRPEMCECEVTVPQFSKATGISYRYIQNLCEAGEITHRRLSARRGSRIRIPRTEIARFQRLEGEI